MRGSHKYRVKVRLKIRNRVAKRTGAVILALACAGLAGYGCYKARKALPFASPSELFAFSLKKFDVRSPSGAISADVSAILRPRIGRGFSGKDAKDLERSLRARYPALRRVSVGRSLIGGRVTVIAEAEPVVVKVRLMPSHGAGGDFYLAENGRLLGETYQEPPADPFETSVYAEPGEVLAPLALFLKELKGLREEFSFKPVSLSYNRTEGTCLLTLENDARIFWGEFGFTRSKVAKLNEVIGDAAQKIGGPLRVDLRYFRDGKVFVSKSGNI